MHIPSLQELLARRYGIRPAALQPLVSTDDKHIYRIDQGSGSPLLARMYPAAAEQAVRDHAAMLQYLELRGYPAPRVIPTTDGAAVVAHGDWYVLLTGYVEGEALTYTPGDLRLLGEALGRLHALCPTGGTRPSLPVAGMLPTNELAWATGRLTGVEPHVPRALRAEYDRILEALRGVHDCEDLPRVLIHNDCHPGNAIRTADGKVVLIDWEGAGWGPAVLDVGFLLISCDTESPWTPRLDADPARIAAVVDGYCRHHLPARVELDRLGDAMRFRTIVYGAVSFAESVTRPGGIDYEWWHARYHASDELAARARMQFERHL